VQALILTVVVLAQLLNSAQIRAQELEPRAYVNTPIGLNFVALGYQYSEGALVFDPALPVTDANARVNMAFLGYVHTLAVAGQSAKVGLVLPVAGLDATGYVEDLFRTRNDSGLADPSFYFALNLLGAPALSYEEFGRFQQETIVGLSFKLTVPLGTYDNDKLLNIGTNRWSFEPEIGVSKALGRWTVEAAAAVIFYTDNDDFNQGQTRQQDPIYSLQGHLVYSFPHNIWAALGVTYYEGGRTTIEGISSDDLQQNWRGGFTLALPIDRKHSIKLYGNSGVSTRTGTDYDTLGLAWQYRWGKAY
jgi:hypothetical protein